MNFSKKGALALCLALVCLSLPVAAEERLPEENAAVLNGQYEFFGKNLRFSDGRASGTVVTHGLAQMTAEILDNPPFVWGDLNGDAKPDAVLLIREQSEVAKAAGYYLAVSLSGEGVSRSGSNALFIGEDIFVKSLAVEQRQIKLTYSDAARDAKPGMSHERRYLIKDGRLSETGYKADEKQYKIAPKRESFRKYALLLGAERQALLERFPEAPLAVENDGVKFVKEGISVWFAGNKVNKILLQREGLSFDGLRLGDQGESFARVFGQSLQTEKDAMLFTGKGFRLKVNYDVKSGKTLAAYLLPE